MNVGVLVTYLAAFLLKGGNALLLLLAPPLQSDELDGCVATFFFELATHRSSRATLRCTATSRCLWLDHTKGRCLKDSEHDLTASSLHRAVGETASRNRSPYKPAVLRKCNLLSRQHDTTTQLVMCDKLADTKQQVGALRIWICIFPMVQSMN